MSDDGFRIYRAVVHCATCDRPRDPLALVPGSSCECGSKSRRYLIGDASGETEFSSPFDPTLSQIDIDEVALRVRVPSSATERRRLLARLEALTKAIRDLASEVQDKDPDLFIAPINALERALGLAKGTEDDMIDGRVLDGDAP